MIGAHNRIALVQVDSDRKHVQKNKSTEKVRSHS
jgi:hypothetical protein